jgi:hypothetical protein
MLTPQQERELLEAALTAFDEVNLRLRKLNDELAGRKPRPELRVLDGGRARAR